MKRLGYGAAAFALFNAPLLAFGWHVWGLDSALFMLLEFWAYMALAALFFWALITLLLKADL